MALDATTSRNPQTGPARSPGLLAALVAAAIGWAGIAYAANNSLQGPKKEEGGFDGDAPTAILIEASSGSVLFEKNADELRAPSSMMKLMTAEVVFRALKQGEIKPTDEYHVSENAWRKAVRLPAARPCSRPFTARFRSAISCAAPSFRAATMRVWCSRKVWPATSAPLPR